MYDDKFTYIYGATIRSLISNQVRGGIGIVFDSNDQFKDMLRDALPQNNREVKKGIFSVFVEKKTKKIISCSDRTYEAGDTFELDSSIFTLSNKESLSKIIELNEKYYIMGATCSNGYREYKSHSDDYINDILALVFIEAGTPIKKENCQELNRNNFFKYPLNNNEEIEEIATFYIGDKWLGVRQNEIVEAISIDTLETPISLESEHHFKGTILHKSHVMSVLDISSFIKNHLPSRQSDIILVKYEGATEDHVIGLVVCKLGEIIRVPKNAIKPLEKHLIGAGMLGKSIVQPPQDSKIQSLLTLLDITKLDSLKK